MRFLLRADCPVIAVGLRGWGWRAVWWSAQWALRAWRPCATELSRNRRDWWRPTRTCASWNATGRWRTRTSPASRGCIVQSWWEDLWESPKSATLVGCKEMHCNDELCNAKCSSLFRICKSPYPTKDLVGQPCPFEDRFRRFACVCASIWFPGRHFREAYHTSQYSIRSPRFVKQRGVLVHLIRR